MIPYSEYAQKEIQNMLFCSHPFFLKKNEKGTSTHLPHWSCAPVSSTFLPSASSLLLLQMNSPSSYLQPTSTCVYETPFLPGLSSNNYFPSTRSFQSTYHHSETPTNIKNKIFPIPDMPQTLQSFQFPPPRSSSGAEWLSGAISPLLVSHSNLASIISS